MMTTWAEGVPGALSALSALSGLGMLRAFFGLRLTSCTGARRPGRHRRQEEDRQMTKAWSLPGSLLGGDCESPAAKALLQGRRVLRSLHSSSLWSGQEHGAHGDFSAASSLCDRLLSFRVSVGAWLVIVFLPGGFPRGFRTA